MDNINNVLNMAIQDLEELTQIDFNYDISQDINFITLDAVLDSLNFNI